MQRILQDYFSLYIDKGLYQFFWHQPELVIPLRTRLFLSPKRRQVSSTSQQEQDIQSRYNEVGEPFYQFWREWDQRQVGHEEALRERERRKTRERKVNSTTKRTKTSKPKKQGIHSSTSFPGLLTWLLGWVDGSRPSTESKVEVPANELDDSLSISIL